MVSARTLLVRGLRTRGHGAICKGEPRDFAIGSSRLSTSFVSIILFSLILYASLYLQWSPQSSIGGMLGVLLLIVVLSVARVITPQQGTYFLVLLAIAGAGWLLLRGESRTVALVYGPPILIVTFGRWGIGALRAAARLPLFIPVVLIIVLAPLLTEDPWKLAATANKHLAWLALLAILPLTAILVVRLTRSDIQSEIEQAIKHNSEVPANAAQVTADMVSKLTVSGERSALSETEVAAMIKESYRKEVGGECVEALTQAARRRFRFQLFRRLLRLLLGTASATYFLVYLLAWAAMPISLAEEWSGQGVPVQIVSFLGITLPIPLGAYLQVSALLAILATAGFLAFASTEDRHEDAIRGSLVSDHINDLVLLALPYLQIKCQEDSG